MPQVHFFIKDVDSTHLRIQPHSSITGPHFFFKILDVNLDSFPHFDKRWETSLSKTLRDTKSSFMFKH